MCVRERRVGRDREQLFGGFFVLFLVRGRENNFVEVGFFFPLTFTWVSLLYSMSLQPIVGFGFVCLLS